MKNIKLEVSARHVHLSQEHVNILFGEGYQLTPKKELSQPGQFACEERVTIVGPKKTFENVAVLGPVRPESQIEFAKSDCFALGIMGLIRESGDIEGTPGVELKTEKGSVMLNKGLIIAKRHIHMTPEDAAEFGVQDKEIVNVKVESDERPLTFGEVVIRVSPKFSLAMHIDTDEGNAVNVGNGTDVKVTIEK
ncbi:MAG: phosphate propanoyltransferase [Clostridiales bacterium]|nr:phosphate propanoyltransferase [Clostridiales bacterium]